MPVGTKASELESTMTEAPKPQRMQQYLTELLPTRTASDKIVMMWRLEIEFTWLFWEDNKGKSGNSYLIETLIL